MISLTVFNVIMLIGMLHGSFESSDPKASAGRVEFPTQSNCPPTSPDLPAAIKNTAGIGRAYGNRGMDQNDFDWIERRESDDPCKALDVQDYKLGDGYKTRDGKSITGEVNKGESNTGEVNKGESNTGKINNRQSDTEKKATMKCNERCETLKNCHNDLKLPEENLFINIESGQCIPCGALGTRCHCKEVDKSELQLWKNYANLIARLGFKNNQIMFAKND